MKLSSIFTAGSMLAGALVQAAPTTGSAASGIVKRNEDGFEVIDFDFVINSIKDINQRYSSGNSKTLQRRDDTDFIDQMLTEFHNNNLLDDFVNQLSEAPHLKEAVESGVTSVISSGLVNETIILQSLRSSGKLSQFFDSVLNDEDLNDELYLTARDILEKNQKTGDLIARSIIDESQPLLDSFYGNVNKRSIYEDDLFMTTYGMSKRDLLSSIVAIVKEISDSGLVQDIIHSIIGNQSLVQYTLNLFTKIFKSINWSSLFTAIKNSGIIQTLFRAILNFITGLFTGGTISNLIDELFGGSSNSTHKSFLGTLLSTGIEIGGDLLSSLTSGSSSGSGLLSELANTLVNGSDTTATKSVSSGSSSSGGFFSTLLNSLFGGSSSSSSSGSSGSSSSGGGFLSSALSLLGDLFGGSSSSKSSGSSSGSSGSGATSGGLLATLFDSLFGGSDSSSSSSSSSGSSSGSGLNSIIDSLFGDSSSGTGSSGNSSPASSSAFSSKKACCCQSKKIKKRALKRALKKKMKRSVKRSVSFADQQMRDGMMNFFLLK